MRNRDVPMRGATGAILIYLLGTSAGALARETAIPAGDGCSSVARYLDDSDGSDWPGYGRTYGEQHYSPLEEVNQENVSRLGLAWSMDLGSDRNTATQPIEINGILYFATGLSIVQAVDAVSGKQLWQYDPKAAEKSGANLWVAWGTRGISWWNGKIFTGTNDGRLIAIDAKTGREVWSVQTFTIDPTDVAHINGPPRVFDGKVIVGWAGDTEKRRGYVTTYDAETGRKLWRFYTVPGNPADGFENTAMELAAKTWSGQWWTHGGGGHVWNAIAYDPDTDTIFIGTGNGFPWNRRNRSEDRGDNLFVSSIVALSGRDGAYKWHCQTTPGDTWDFDAVADIEFADLPIGGRMRKILMQAPKNGFFYVIDRVTGQLISAEPYAKVTWARRIDLKTGRPLEIPGARYPSGTSVNIWPWGGGAHSWMPMAFSSLTNLAYIPVIEAGYSWSDPYIEERGPAAPEASGELVAWDPVSERVKWTVHHPTQYNGGVLATRGNLVFQGSIDGLLNAYRASNGQVLWSFKTQAPLLAAPITYMVKGHQYVTILTGMGMGISADAGRLKNMEQYGIDPRTQARRVLTFSLDGTRALPATPSPPPPPADPEFRLDPKMAKLGEDLYGRCSICHGVNVIGSSHAPDLRRSSFPLHADAFAAVVRGGALVPLGMPAWRDCTDEELAELRQYIRTAADDLRHRMGPFGRSPDDGSH